MILIETTDKKNVVSKSHAVIGTILLERRTNK